MFDEWRKQTDLFSGVHGHLYKTIFLVGKYARQFADRLLSTRIMTGFGMLVFVVAAAGIYWLWNRQLSSTPGLWIVAIFVNGVLVQSESVTAT